MKPMRLDKYLSLAGIASRTETSKAVRGGEVLVDGVPAKKADMQVDPDAVQVTFKGQPVVYRQFTYILLHKPDGVVSATEDGREQTVLDLLPEELRRIRPALFPCGRLDKHTTGLMTAPCKVELDPKDPEERGSSGRITLHEGKYHQIKLMMEARHNQITRLQRITFGPLILDPALDAGEWRMLTEGEVRALEEKGEARGEP